MGHSQKDAAHDAEARHAEALAPAERGPIRAGAAVLHRLSFYQSQTQLMNHVAS